LGGAERATQAAGPSVAHQATTHRQPPRHAETRGTRNRIAKHA
jgi:hypothetical protein